MALGAQAQSTLIDIIEMIFIPMYNVLGPFLFIMSLLLMVWVGFRLTVTVYLRVAIIMRYQGCGLWIFAVFWVNLFQLGVFPFNWIDKSDRRGESEGEEDAEHRGIPQSNPRGRAN